MKTASRINESIKNPLSGEVVKARIVKMGEDEWNLALESGREFTFNSEKIKEFLNSTIHPNHEGSDFADDGEEYLLKADEVKKFA